MRKIKKSCKGSNQKIDNVQKRVEYLLADSPAVFYICKIGKNWSCTFVSENVTKQLGYTPAEFCEKTDFRDEGIHPDDKQRVFDGLSRIGEDGHFVYEYRFLNKSGEYRWLRDELKLTYDADGNPVDCIGFLLDITQRKRAEEELQKSECKFRELFDSTRDGVYQTDAAGVFTAMNRAGARIFGYESPEEIIGRNVLEYWRDPADRDALMSELKSGKSVSAYPILARRKSGEPIELEASSSIMEDEKGNILGIGGILRDVSERKLMEETLMASERKYRNLTDNAQIGIYKSGLDGRFLYVNRALAEIYEFRGPAEMMLENDLLRYKNKNDRVAFLTLLKKNGKVDHLELETISKSGTAIHILMSAALEGDTISGMVLNITDQKKLEAQLRQAQKMESIGTLAGGIAHDFNNILSAIIGYGHITLMKMPEDDPLRLNIEHILQSADRAAALTQSLLTFSRKQVIELKPVELNSILKKVEKFLVRVIGEDVVVHTVLAEGDLTTLADEGSLEQVLMNLATNARDAMPNGGLFTLETAITKFDNGFISAHGYGKRGTYALIVATDTGMGMNEETRKKIFEPFFTTKEVGKGTGLGLAMAYGIIKQHEGYINVYSEPGKGTTFKIYLPLIKTEAVEEQRTIATEYPKGGTETILLAEDDASLRKLSVLVLEQMGYTVIIANDGEEAVTKFTENKDRIQLLLFDIIMPKKNGREAYEEIKKTKPDIPVLFASGYSPDMLRVKELVNDDAALVYKPISPQSLLKKVREVLDRKR